MDQKHESRATDPAFAIISEVGLDTSECSETHTSIQPKTNPITDHQRASGMLGFALDLGETDVWLGAIQVWQARLNSHELTSLSYTALKAQTPEDAARTVEAVFGQSGTPLPPLISPMDDASFWADFTDSKYIKACVLAGFNRMPISDQTAFIEFVQGRKAA
jgi:hypothetical protein